MLREYEMTLIARGDLAEGSSSKVFEKYEGLMKQGQENAIIKRDDWGVRKLAFPINKHFRGHYVIYDFVAEPATIAEMERLMRIDEDVLRYMTLNIGEDVDIEARKTQLQKQAAKEAAESEKREKSN